MTKNKPLKKLRTTYRRIEKPKTTLWEKGNVHPRLLKSAEVSTTLGQKYAKLKTAKCLQKNITKLAIKQKLGARMGAEQY